VIDRQEWKDRTKKERPVASVHALLQAVPKMETLTNSEEWDKFLSYIKAEVEQSEKQEKTFIEQLLNPSVWDSAELVRIKAAILTVRSRINSLTAASEVPKNIIERGKAADNLLGQQTV
jgi:hypothetical protein